MPKIKYRFSLSQEERDELNGIVAKGKHNSQKVLNALILLNYDEDSPEPRTLREHAIANVLKVSEMKIHRVNNDSLRKVWTLHSTGVRGNGRTSARPMAISRHILLLSAAVSRRKDKRSGRCGYSRIRWWS